MKLELKKTTIFRELQLKPQLFVGERLVRPHAECWKKAKP